MFTDAMEWLLDRWHWLVIIGVLALVGLSGFLLWVTNLDDDDPDWWNY